jgi:hypothetical protein
MTTGEAEANAIRHLTAFVMRDLDENEHFMEQADPKGLQALRDSISIALHAADDLMPHTCPEGHRAVEVTAITTLRKCGECDYRIETDEDGNAW